MKKILEKLDKCRELVRSGKYKKDGRNDYSKYDYFTPEMIEHIVSEVTAETKTICLCNLKADQFGLYQELIFIDKESDEQLTFELRTEKGVLTATNATQQLGGTDTYSERYIKSKVFNIKDNNLDFDSKDNRVKEVNKSSSNVKFNKVEVEEVNIDDMF